MSSISASVSRVQHLLDCARVFVASDQTLFHYYAWKAADLARLLGVQLPADLVLCRHCSAVQLPGSNCTVRISTCSAEHSANRRRAAKRARSDRGDRERRSGGEDAAGRDFLELPLRNEIVYSCGICSKTSAFSGSTRPRKRDKGKMEGSVVGQGRGRAAAAAAASGLPSNKKARVARSANMKESQSESSRGDRMLGNNETIQQRTKKKQIRNIKNRKGGKGKGKGKGGGTRNEKESKSDDVNSFLSECAWMT